MSLSEFDKDILLQEIKQIQQTLDLEVNSKVLDSDVTNIQDGNSSTAQKTVLYHEDEENDDTESIHSTFYVYESQKVSDDELSENSSASTSVVSKQSFNNGERPTFGHFFQALENNSIVETANLQPENEIIGIENLNNDLVNVNNDLDNSNSMVISSLHTKLKERIDLQTNKQFKKTTREMKLSKEKKSSKEKNSPTNKSDDDLSSIEISVPSTYQTTSKKEKEKISMTNIYIERIFRDFRNKDKKPTIADVKRIDSRDLKSNASIGTLENLLQVNRQYQETLADELKKVQLSLARNEKLLDNLQGNMGRSNMQKMSFKGLSRACLGRFRPYFKDSDGFAPPDNEDTLEIKQHVKVRPFSKGSRIWKVNETKVLREGVYQNNLEKRLAPVLQELKEYDKEYKKIKKTDKNASRAERTTITNKIATIKSLPKEEVLKDLNDIDFFKISKNFLPDRDEFECQLQWFNVAHPSINQTKFTKKEDEMILKLSKQYQNHNWEDIAKELGTNRTPVQCLQRFQRTLNKDILKTTWSTEDDKKLTEAVEKFSRNWILISDYLGDRTSDQCIHRWEKTLNPAIKRGKWTGEEDQLLLNAIKNHGTKNWKTIKLYVPGRTDSQCRDRYTSSLDPSINWGPFSEEEDIKILELADKYGVGKWSAIAKEFPDRKDNQIWRRFKVISSQEYEEYRRQVVWKKNSILTYFMHRDDEKRDYDLKEMSIDGVVPTLCREEKQKIKKVANKMRKHGNDEEAIAIELEKIKKNGIFPSASSSKRFKKRKEIHSDQDKTTPFKLTVDSIRSAQKGIKTLLTSFQNGKVDVNWVEKIVSESLDDMDRRRRVPKTVEIRRRLKSVEKALTTNCNGQGTKLIDEIINEDDITVSDDDSLAKNNSRKINKKSRRLKRTSNKRKLTRPKKVTEIIARHATRRSRRVVVKEEEPLVSAIDFDLMDENKEPKDEGLEYESDECVENEESEPEENMDRRVIEELNEQQESTVDVQVGEDEFTSCNEGSSLIVTDQLKIFTLLLQALHIDTAGVMRSIPENQHLADMIHSNSEMLENKPFPVCYPLCPNSATLRGFRTLLLNRRKLNEHVENCKKKLVGRTTGSPLDPNVFRKTRMYDTLSKRFKSMFIWPAFLATFIPRYVQEKQLIPFNKVTPAKMSYLNPNKRMIFTPEQIRPQAGINKNISTSATGPERSNSTLASSSTSSQDEVNKTSEKQITCSTPLTTSEEAISVPASTTKSNSATISTISPSCRRNITYLQKKTKRSKDATDESDFSAIQNTERLLSTTESEEILLPTSEIEYNSKILQKQNTERELLSTTPSEHKNVEDSFCEQTMENLEEENFSSNNPNLRRLRKRKLSSSTDVVYEGSNNENQSSCQTNKSSCVRAKQRKTFNRHRTKEMKEALDNIPPPKTKALQISHKIKQESSSQNISRKNSDKANSNDIFNEESNTDAKDKEKSIKENTFEHNISSAQTTVESMVAKITTVSEKSEKFSSMNDITAEKVKSSLHTFDRNITTKNDGPNTNIEAGKAVKNPEESIKETTIKIAENTLSNIEKISSEKSTDGITNLQNATEVSDKTTVKAVNLTEETVTDQLTINIVTENTSKKRKGSFVRRNHESVNDKMFLHEVEIEEDKNASDESSHSDEIFIPKKVVHSSPKS